jgi:hypothetical protein
MTLKISAMRFGIRLNKKESEELTKGVNNEIL